MIIEVMLVLLRIKLIIIQDKVDLNHYVFEVKIKFLFNKIKYISIDRSPFGPELSIPNDTEYEVQSGDLIELPCGIVSLSTSSQILWWKDGIELDNFQEKIYHNSLILQVSSNDSGIYTCQINDESIGRITSMMSLKVNRKLFENYITVSDMGHYFRDPTRPDPRFRVVFDQ